MKSLRLLPLIILSILSAMPLIAATPPPNDDRANAILLTGDNFTHTTEVHCATEQVDELPYGRFPRPQFDNILDLLELVEKRTVWWKWQSPAGGTTSAMQLAINSSAPDSALSIPHIEVFAGAGNSLNSVQIIYTGFGRAFLVEPNKTYYLRGFYATDPGTTQPDNVTLTVTGEHHPLATNLSIASSETLIKNTFPEVYARSGTHLFYTWTPDTTGFPVLVEGSPAFAEATVYPEIDSLEGATPIEGPVIAGETYTVVFYTSTTSQDPVFAGGSFSIYPPASNSTFEGRKPAIETPLTDRTELSLVASDFAREFWWTFTPTEDGLLKTIVRGARVPLQEKVFENEQNTTAIPIISDTVLLTANTTYTISLRTTSGRLTNFIDQTFTFYPTANLVNIVDPDLNGALRLAFNLPENVPIPQAFLTDLSDLRVRAFQDCDDDDCSSHPPGFPVAQLDGLESAQNLEYLYFQGGERDGHSISDLSPIKGLTKLTTLRLPNALKGTDGELQTAIQDLAELTQLTWLSLEQNNLKNSQLEPIVALTSLEILDIDDNQISDLSPIAGLTLIKTLDIDDNPVVDLSPLSSLQNLQDLDLNPLHNGLSSLPPLRNLETIKVVSDDLGPLARLTNLREIEFSAFSRFPTPSRIRDLTPLANLPRLTFSTQPQFSNAVRDLRPLFLQKDPDIGQSKILLSELSRDSSADPSDPATAELFERANINPDERRFTPYDPNSIIPDGKLRLNINNGPAIGVSGEPTQARLDLMIHLGTDGIESLEGIANASNLRQITFINGWITDLTPISGMTTLTRLNFQNNFINDVSPIAHLTDINIDLRGNPIDHSTIPAAWIDNPSIQVDPPSVLDPSEDIPDPVLRSLIRIALGKPVDSPLVSADLADLRTLHADFANILSLNGLEEASNLTGLSLRNNILNDLSPIPTENLRWLRVSGNPLDNTSLALLDTLEASGVVVDNNEETRFLSAITPSNNVVFADDYQLPLVRYLCLFPEVTTLFLSHNYLSDIPELADLPNLETVYLEGNLLVLDEDGEAQQVIDDLRARGVTVHTDSQRPEVSAEFFVSQVELRKATADALNLPFIPPAFSQAQLESIINFDWEESVGEVILDDPTFISQMTNLEFLSLERAGLSDVTFLENLTKLKRLDLDFNQITDIEPLRNMTDLRELDLNDNQISDISVIANFPQLLSLDIDHNCIGEIQSLSNLTDLLELELHFNKIKDVTPLSGLNALESIDLRQNGIDYSAADQANIFAALDSRIELPILYPQHVVQPEISLNGTMTQLSWIAEPRTSYHVFFSSTLQGNFTFVRTIQPTSDAQVIEYDFNSGTQKGFFQIHSFENPYHQ